MSKIANNIVIIILITILSACGNNKTESSVSGHIDKVIIGVVNMKDINGNEPMVDITDTCMLWIYYPKYSNIDLVCGDIPQKDNDSVILVCAAAYTAKCLNHFDHGNIIGKHVSGGKLYKGANNATKLMGKASYRGAFSFYDGNLISHTITGMMIFAWLHPK